MVNVLVFGATGHIGNALCRSLVTSGTHRVYGLARTNSKAVQLAHEEVIPILGSLGGQAGDVDILANIDMLHIDIIVDASSARHEIQEFLKSLVAHEELRLAAVATDIGSKIIVPKRGFIYTSGTWVHGSSTAPKNDLFPVGVASAPDQPPELLTYRPGLERDVLSASGVLDTLIIRPALVYGRSSEIWSPYFKIIHEAKISSGGGPAASTVSIGLDPESRPALIHVDDVATGIHAAVDKLPLISGTGVYPVFDLATSRESMRDIMVSAGRELGFEGQVVLSGTGRDLFAQAMSVTGNLDSGRAKQILGWVPKRSDFVGGMDRFIKAWVAHKYNFE